MGNRSINFVRSSDEVEEHNDLLTALKSKKVTPQSYNVIVHELLQQLGVIGVQCAIIVKDGLIQPDVRIPILDDEIN